MSWVERLKREYARGCRQLVAYRQSLDKSDPLQLEECKIVSGMISDMQYALKWMRTGRRPQSRKGAETSDAYRYAELRDMDLFPSLDLSVDPEKLSDEQKRKIIRVLMVLSPRERQCYLLHMAHGLSQEEVASELKISRRSVRTFIERAKSKIQQAI